MKNILVRANFEILEQFAWSNTLLAFDYDGTLSPIVSHPEKAHLRSTTRNLLVKLTSVYPVIVISGRSQANVQSFLKGIPLRAAIGNHGMEPWFSGERLSHQVSRWLPTLEHQLAGWQGVWVENKVFSVAIHYRHARRKKAAREAIFHAASLLGKVRIIGGKKVVNLLPDGVPHKGVALVRERTRLGCDTAIYIGDDETDEDVFFLRQPGRLLSIRVGKKKGSSAHYFIPRQRDINQLLGVLWTLRGPKSLYQTRKG